MNTLPIFSASAPVLGVIGKGNAKVSPFTLAIAVGLTKESEGSSLVTVDISLKDVDGYQNTPVKATIYASKVLFDYNGNKHHLSGMFGDIFIPGDPGYSPPCDPRTGYCPENIPLDHEH
ncbi:hypothetical protein [Thermococcus aciditolerans]|uniref:Uncharacterized protein n=1 Tax=Thermococcus aciditolerans TaxID=2598455 RepID=A0A5C0SIU4_9EURY|nr:hypothetical protein [Thermococcus aciditolerans]QEK14231.1 hypothetical protein FPV09_02915 [Thermococcus aciditolerans]